MADSKGDFVVGLLIGGAVGAALALLYAPATGDDTRDTLKKRSEELKGSAMDAYDKVKEQSASLAAQVKDGAASLAASIPGSPDATADEVHQATATDGPVAFPA